MRKRIHLVLLLLIISIQFVPGQGLYSPGQPEDDGRFAASTKQVKQFFRRFNGEESQDGKERFYPGKKQYQDRSIRQKFIGVRLDNETTQEPKELKNAFLNEDTAEYYPQYLKFHKGNWFAEDGTISSYQGKREQITLFMKLLPEGLSY